MLLILRVWYRIASFMTWNIYYSCNKRYQMDNERPPDLLSKVKYQIQTITGRLYVVLRRQNRSTASLCNMEFWFSHKPSVCQETQLEHFGTLVLVGKRLNECTLLTLRSLDTAIYSNWMGGCVQIAIFLSQFFSRFLAHILVGAMQSHHQIVLNEELMRADKRPSN